VVRGGAPPFAGSMLATLMLAFVTFSLAYGYLMAVRLRVGRLEDRSAVPVSSLPSPRARRPRPASTPAEAPAGTLAGTPAPAQAGTPASPRPGPERERQPCMTWATWPRAPRSRWRRWPATGGTSLSGRAGPGAM